MQNNFGLLRIVNFWRVFCKGKVLIGEWYRERRVRIDSMSSGGNTHWCYQCRQPVRPRTRGVICPYCDGGFVQELDELSTGPGRNNSSYGVRDSPDQLLGIMEALDSLMVRSNPEHRLSLIEALDTFMGQRTRYSMDADRNPSLNPNPNPNPGPWLIFQGQMPGRIPVHRSSGGFEMFFDGNPGIGFSRGNNGELFVGPGLQELIEQLMVERQGPPPAPRSAIDAMPTIKITRTHIQTDSHCPVCKDEFELGTEARQMPCNHIYHSDCIVPWLIQHNSCPVCRHELGSNPSNCPQNPSIETMTTSTSNSSERLGSDQNSSWRNPFSFLWPFRSSNSSSSNSREYVPPSASNSPPPPPLPPPPPTRGENNEMHYSGWPFDY